MTLPDLIAALIAALLAIWVAGALLAAASAFVIWRRVRRADREFRKKWENR